MRSFMNGFVTCIGIVSSFLALMDAFPKYNSIFLLLLGVCVGFWLNSFNEKNSSSQPKDMAPSNSKPSPIALFVLPVMLLLAVVVTIHVLGLMTQDLLLLILIFGGIVVFISSMLALAMILGASSDNTGDNDRPHKQ